MIYAPGIDYNFKTNQSSQDKIILILYTMNFVHDKNDIVFPAKAGIHFWCRMMALRTWIPAFAGTTNFKNFVFCHVQSTMKHIY